MDPDCEGNDDGCDPADPMCGAEDDGDGGCDPADPHVRRRR